MPTTEDLRLQVAAVGVRDIQRTDALWPAELVRGQGQQVEACDIQRQFSRTL